MREEWGEGGIVEEGGREGEEKDMERQLGAELRENGGEGEGRPIVREA